MADEAAQEGTDQPQQTEQAPAPEGQPDTGSNGQTEQVDVQALHDEIAKWKAQARKHEDRAKANSAAAKELEQAKRAAMSEQERAVAQARDEARAETVREMGSRLVAAEIRGVLKGRLEDGPANALLESVDKSRFLSEDGEPDTKAITKWVDAVAPPKQEREFPDLAQGVRQPGPQRPDMNQLIRSAKFGQT